MYINNIGINYRMNGVWKSSLSWLEIVWGEQSLLAKGCAVVAKSFYVTVPLAITIRIVYLVVSKESIRIRM